MAFKNQLVEIYSTAISGKSEKFSLGYFQIINDDFSVVESIDGYGILESIQLLRNDYISNVIAKSDYVMGYRKIITRNKQSKIDDLFQLQSKYETIYSQIETFNDLEVGKIYTVVTASENTMTTGQLLAKDSQALTLSPVSVEGFGKEDCQIPIEDIVLVDLLSIENELITEINQIEG